MLVAGHHDGRLQISQRHHVVARLGVQGDVDLVVGDALLVQRLVGGVALHACRLGVNGDAHGRYNSSVDAKRYRTGNYWGIASALLFSSPPRHRIPVLPIRVSWRAMPVGASRPTRRTWGLSVSKHYT